MAVSSARVIDPQSRSWRNDCGLAQRCTAAGVAIAAAARTGRVAKLAAALGQARCPSSDREEEDFAALLHVNSRFASGLL